MTPNGVIFLFFFFLLQSLLALNLLTHKYCVCNHVYELIT